MPRKGPVAPREIEPDTLYKDKLVAQLINKVLKSGKKSLAETRVYHAFDIIKKKAGDDPVTVLKKAVNNAKPLLEVRSRRVGGATYQVPVEVPKRRGVTLAIRWIVKHAREKEGKPIEERIAEEILEAAANSGASVKKKEDLHKMAEANRAFAHYRW